MQKRGIALTEKGGEVGMIDRKTVIKELENYEPYARVFSNITITGSVVLDALTLLKEQSEVVRCKDCLHADCFDSYVLCRKSSEKRKEPLDWFCADGERKVNME